MEIFSCTFWYDVKILNEKKSNEQYNGACFSLFVARKKEKNFNPQTWKHFLKIYLLYSTFFLFWNNVVIQGVPEFIETKFCIIINHIVWRVVNRHGKASPRVFSASGKTKFVPLWDHLLSNKNSYKKITYVKIFPKIWRPIHTPLYPALRRG